MSESQIQSTEFPMAGYSVDNLAGSTQYSIVSYLEVCQKTFKSNLDYFDYRLKRECLFRSKNYTWGRYQKKAPNSRKTVFYQNTDTKFAFYSSHG